MFTKDDLNLSMTPIWKGDTVYNETVLLIDPEDPGKLLYPDAEILSVRSSDLETEYEKGRDFEAKDGIIRLTEGTRFPFIGREKYYSSGDAPYLKCNRDGSTSDMYYSEAISQYQLAVTYRHSSGWGEKLIPKTEKEQFSRLLEKLKNGEDVTLFYYGDSITYGASASSVTGKAPGMPTYPELVTMYLAEQFGYTVSYLKTDLPGVWRGQDGDTVFGTNGRITYINPSVGGWTGEDGYRNYDTYVRPFLDKYGCDFFLLGFGMNDGGNPPEAERSSIRRITDLVYAQAPDTCLALLATMVPNPEVTNGWYGKQETYEKAFEILAEEYQSEGRRCAVIPMAGMSLSILKTKRFRDYTGNNVNHPNDFFARIYAQTVFQTVIGYDTVNNK